MNLSLSKVARRTFVVASMLFMLSFAAGASADNLVSYWHLSEAQPDVKEGGRANTVAVNPDDPIDPEMFAASDSGGLFKSVDGGYRWTHVKSLPVIFTQSIVFLPGNVMLVSAKADFKSTNGGGIWRSTDGGENWTQLLLPITPGVRVSAYELSAVGNTVVAGTSEGVLVSFNGGLLWEYANAFSGQDRRVFAVLLSPNGRIYAGGPAGVSLGTTADLTLWTRPIGDPTAGNGLQNLHAFGRSPLPLTHTFLVNRSGQLFRTENEGTTWIPMQAPPLVGTCAGAGFLKTARAADSPSLTLYLGNDCGLHRLIAPVNGTTPDYSGMWDTLTVDRAGTRDLALSDSKPVLLATVGGLHKTADGGATWKFAGGGKDGYNALQISEVKGQLIGRSKRPGTDLYLATQDNNLLAANVNVPDPDWIARPAEGAFIEAERRIPTIAESRITYMACAPLCRSWISGQHFTNEMPWSRPTAAPVLIKRFQYVQNVSSGLNDTENSGMTWGPFAQFPEEARGLPKLGTSGEFDPDPNTIVYQTFRSPLTPWQYRWGSRLMRISRANGFQGNGTVVRAKMQQFGAMGYSLASGPAFHPVYGIDPSDAHHLIAPDLDTGRMMQSGDGGDWWEEMTDLTKLVTGNGTRLFRTALNDSFGPVFPVVTAISFSPQNPNLVLVGTNEGGIFYSNDNGATWSAIANTEKATYITSFFWKDLNTVYVSTFGRGLWKLQHVTISVPDFFDETCGTCQVISEDPNGGRPPFDGSALVFEGTILGIRTEKSRLREVFVTHGSSVVFTGDQKDPQDDIVITESDGSDTTLFEPLPKAPKDGWMATGVVFTSDDTVTGTVFAESELSMVPPPSGEKYETSTDSPTKGQPYIRVTSATFTGVPTVVPRETFELSATDFASGETYEVLIDGVPIKGTVVADSTGSFGAKIAAPDALGYHEVAVRLPGEEQVIDATAVLVRHEN